MVTTVDKMLEKGAKRSELVEFIKNKLRDALIGDISITTSPIGTNIIIYCMKPGLVIGTRGRTIKSLQEEVEKRFNLENVQISVSEIEVPELNAALMAQRIAQAIASGVRWRRVAFWALRRILDTGAIGAEIVVSGKLTSARARSEKFTAGLLPKSGEFAKNVRVGVAHVQLATGMYGVQVKIYPPNAPLPEEVRIVAKDAKKATEEVSLHGEGS